MNEVRISALDRMDSASFRSEIADRRAAERVSEAVQKLNRTEFPLDSPRGSSYAFSYDPEARRETVNIVDKATGQVMYQMPAREILRLAAAQRRNGQAYGPK